MKSILQNEKQCFFTGRTDNLQKHHVMNGNGLRPKAEKYGLWVWLTATEHERIHSAAGTADRIDLKRTAQAKFEETHTRAEWMALFHKNYL